MHFLELRQDILEKINVIIANDTHRSFYFYSNDVNIERFLRKGLPVKVKNQDQCLNISYYMPESILTIHTADILYGGSLLFEWIYVQEEELFYYKMKYC